MGLLIRALLIWLLVLSVPAQGAAAVTMAFCSPHHHGVAQASRSQPSGPTAHAHHGHAAQPDDATAAATGVASPAKFVQSDEHKCSACASCCSAGAILSTMPQVAAAEVGAVVFVSVVPSVDPFAASGPDRPPRGVLA